MRQKDRSEYLSMRREYEPASADLTMVIVTESPPISGEYFYDKVGSAKEPLFKAVVRQAGWIWKAKDEGLTLLRGKGWLLVDATYTPVNGMDEGFERDHVIMDDYDALVDDLKRVMGDRWSEVPIVLVKKNVCKLLGGRLKCNGFNVLNAGRVVPFPTHWRPNAFFEGFYAVAGATNYRDAEDEMWGKWYPPGERPAMTTAEIQIRQYEIDELLKDDPERKARAEAALAAGDDDLVAEILFHSKAEEK
jgi:hypothetical protein